MSIEHRLLALFLSLALLIAIVQLIRRYKLREEYALLWLVTGVVIFILSIIPEAVKFLGSVFEVSYAPTLILSLGLLFALAISLSQSVTITTLSDRVRDLAQAISILQCQTSQLQTEAPEVDDAAGGKSEGIQPISRQLAADLIVLVDRIQTLERNQSSLSERVDQLEAEASRVKDPAGEGASSKILSTSAQSTGLGPDPAEQTTISQKAHARRVLVIGLDGATLDLIQPWADQGYLPTLRHLMATGAYGKLRSTIPPITAPAWTSFATGTNPGKHGLYDWIARKPDSYRFPPTTGLACKTPTIYSLLSQAGRRVCVVNTPMTYPVERVNGIMVSGLPAPSTRVTITYPPTLYGEILQAVGDYILYPDPGQAYSDAGVDAFLKRLYDCSNLRAHAFDYLRGREKWDFAMVVFNGTDAVCHAMWKHMDPSHPLHDPSRYSKYGNAIRDYYQFIDEYLGKIVKGLDDDTTLIVMSDHGFGPFHKFIHVNNWLIRSGFMRLHPGLRSRAKATLFHLGFSPMGVYDALMRLGLGGLKREVVRGQGQRLLKTLFLSFDDVDWSRTLAYSVGNVGQIYLNVIGREPLGCVHPDAEYEQVRAEIMAQLAELRDPETGEVVVEAIHRREDVYSGDQLEKAPDIVFIPRRLEYFGFGEYEFGGHKIIEAVRRGISGTHRMDGVCLAYGLGIRANLQVEGAQIIDLAPTVLHLMGEPVPEHMDGHVLQDILCDDLESAPLGRRPIHWDAHMSAEDGQFTEEDEQVIAERLRNLGYVG